MKKLSEIAARGMRQGYKIQQLDTFEQTVDLLALGEAFHADSDHGAPFNAERLHKSAILLRQSPNRDNMNCWILYKSDKAIGFLVATANDLWYSDGRAAEQVMWFVLPAYRHTFAPFVLLDTYVQWAKAVGATQIFTGSTNARYSETISKQLSKLGFARVGALHYMGI